MEKSKLFLAIGLILVVGGIIARFTFYPISVGSVPVTIRTILILGNTSLLLAIFFKK